jgi:hypothetical protein
VSRRPHSRVELLLLALLVVVLLGTIGSWLRHR